MGRSDPRSRKRAGQEVRHRLRREAWTSLVESQRYLVPALLAYLLLVGLVGWLGIAVGTREGIVGLIVGLLLGAIPYIALYFFVSRGLPHRGMGADAERWTAEELAKLDGRRWTVFHHVPTDHGDIDHVIVGPGRVYSVETKWTAWTDVDGLLKSAARQAERQAKDLERLLGAGGVRRDVRPLLVLWGPGVSQGGFGDKPRKAGTSTAAVPGKYASDWIARIEGAADGLERDQAAEDAIDSYVRGREAEAKRGPGDARKRGGVSLGTGASSSRRRRDHPRS